MKTKIDITSRMMIALRFALESRDSISVFPLTTIRPLPVRYASKILDHIDICQNIIDYTSIMLYRKAREGEGLINETITSPPVENIIDYPRLPIISPPVGKSGPGMYSSNSCS